MRLSWQPIAVPAPAIRSTGMTEPIRELETVCPYCGEAVSLLVEADLSGELVIDCEVCCNPWRVTIERSGEQLELRVSRLDD